MKEFFLKLRQSAWHPQRRALDSVPFKTIEQQRRERDQRADASAQCAARLAYHEGFKAGRCAGYWSAYPDAIRLAREEVAREEEARKIQPRRAHIILLKHMRRAA